MVMKSRNKTILVTGGCGYIGSVMVQLLLSQGFKVVVIDNLSSSKLSPIKDDNYCFINADISDAIAVKKIFQDHKIHAAFHFAASIEAGVSMKEPSSYYKNNVANSIIFIDEVLKNNPNVYFIFSSTAAVYKTKNELISENDIKNPSNIYGKTKLIIEDILHDYGKILGLKYGILRYFNACGADFENHLGENRKFETHIIPLLLRHVNRKDVDFSIYGNDYKTKDGTCVRDYIHVKDICLVHLKMLDYLENGGNLKCFNIGSGVGYSVLEIVKKVQEITSVDFEVKYKDRREGDPDFLVASNNLIKSNLDWNPKFSSLDEILSSAWAWEKYIANNNT